MISGRFLIGRGFDRLSLEDKVTLENSVSHVKVIPARKMLVRQGEPVRYCTLLLEGIICRYVIAHQGERQTVGMYVPGDFVDLDGLQVGSLDHDIVTIGAVKVAMYRHDTLTSLSERLPNFTRILWISTLLEAAIHREWIFRLGRLGAEARIAHLFCELHTRLEMVGLVQNNGFELPLTQVDIGEATSLTSVHVNRVIRSLRERGLLKLTNRRIDILDKKGLAAVGNFKSDYLYV